MALFNTLCTILVLKKLLVVCQATGKLWELAAIQCSSFFKCTNKSIMGEELK